MFLVSAQAAEVTSINSIISQYKEDVLVNNMSETKAFVNLVNSIKEQGITTAELLEYVKNNSSEDEYENFSMAMDFGTESIVGLEDLNTSDLELIVSQTLSFTSATGASFQSCEGNTFVGVALVLGGVIMAIRAIDTYAEYEDSGSLLRRRDGELLDEAQRYTVLSVVGIAAGAAIGGSCN